MMGSLSLPFRVFWVNLAPVLQVFFPQGHRDIFKQKTLVSGPCFAQDLKL